MAGLFLCLEGLDGSGKSTQLTQLLAWLNESGFQPMLVREPGGTPAGEQLRMLLLDPHTQLSLVAEMLLYMASRAELVQTVIQPALAEGRLVVADRYLWSTVAYQGYGGGLGQEPVEAVGRIATGGLLPDWTGILDVDVATANARRAAVSLVPDRIEARAAEYHERVREGFLAQAIQHPDRITIIDASAGPEQVQTEIRREVTRVLAAAGWS